MLPLKALLLIALIAPALQPSGWTAQQSWAVGVVVPQGAELENGARLVWSEVRNVTAIVTLPNISSTTGVIYVVLSAMAGNGEIMQVAAGLYPGSSSWYVYPMVASASGTIYTQISGYSNQSIWPCNTLSMSIAAVNGSWWFSVVDLNTSKASSCSFGVPSSDALANGSQYVLALESYTSNSLSFSNMGVMVMDSLLINGVPLAGGEYVYSTWNGAGYPLFIVGGASPPQFIYCYASGGKAYWEYVQEWGQTPGQASPEIIYDVLIAAAVLNASALLALLALRPRNRA